MIYFDLNFSSGSSLEPENSADLCDHEGLWCEALSSFLTLTLNFTLGQNWLRRPLTLYNGQRLICIHMLKTYASICKSVHRPFRSILYACAVLMRALAVASMTRAGGDLCQNESLYSFIKLMKVMKFYIFMQPRLLARSSQLAARSLQPQLAAKKRVLRTPSGLSIRPDD